MRCVIWPTNCSSFTPNASSFAATLFRPTHRGSTNLRMLFRTILQSIRPQPSRTLRTDMETPTPMDRLIIGDVGYGKTEVAMRAAFKAVMDGKQAAILTPTTVLAYQHFETFKKRFAAFPVKGRTALPFSIKQGAKSGRRIGRQRRGRCADRHAPDTFERCHDCQNSALSSSTKSSVSASATKKSSNS